jgi:hypothetical protein
MSRALSVATPFSAGQKYADLQLFCCDTSPCREAVNVGDFGLNQVGRHRANGPPRGTGDVAPMLHHRTAGICPAGRPPGLFLFGVLADSGARTVPSSRERSSSWGYADRSER